MIRSLEFWSALFNFAGAAVLALDALSIKKRIAAQAGAESLLAYLRQLNAGHLLEDDRGKALESTAAIQAWLSEGTLKRGWIGFVLMAVGFVLALVDASI